MDIIFKGFTRTVSKNEIMSYRVYYNNEYHPYGMTGIVSDNFLIHIKRK